MPDVKESGALPIPNIGRLNDWLGPWAMEPESFSALWNLARSTDWPAHMAAMPGRKSESLTEIMTASNGKKVAVVRIAGTLMKSASSFGGTSTVQIRREVRAAAADPNIAAILLSVDSPGGAVAGTADAANDIKAARRKKPVWAHIDDLGASAAYWMTSQAGSIYANNATALIGSIGTYVTVADLSAAAERDGVKIHLFTTGPLKGIGVPGSAMTEEQAAHIQRLVDDTQTHFDDAVRRGRMMNAAELAAVRSGAVFPASEAQSLKLIDGIKSFDSTLETLAASV